VRARLTVATAAISRYWLTRTRFVATLRVQVQSIIDLHIEPECLYCGATSGLAAELLQDIEELFQNFLRDTGEAQNLPDYKFQKWLRYFKAHAQYRTTCVECAELIQDYHHKLRRRARRNGLGRSMPAGQSLQTATAILEADQTPAQPPTPATPVTPFTPLLVAEDPLAKRRALIQNLGPGPRAVIKRWIQLARE
jgi:hypothetical protein